MLIEFHRLTCPKKVTGIIHIGAHECEENDIYLSTFNNLNQDDIIWIEAMPHMVDQVKKLYPNFRIFNECISNIDGNKVSFMITNNGQSSSMFEFGTHAVQHPHVVEIDRIELVTKTLDTFCMEQSLNMTHYNFLNLDIQGAEYFALQGAVKLLESVDYIYCEINVDELYKVVSYFQNLINS